MPTLSSDRKKEEGPDACWRDKGLGRIALGSDMPLVAHREAMKGIKASFLRLSDIILPPLTF